MMRVCWSGSPKSGVDWRYKFSSCWPQVVEVMQLDYQVQRKDQRRGGVQGQSPRYIQCVTMGQQEIWQETVQHRGEDLTVVVNTDMALGTWRHLPQSSADVVSLRGQSVSVCMKEETQLQGPVGLGILPHPNSDSVTSVNTSESQFPHPLTGATSYH